MQGFVLKASEPLYGRAREILPIAPLRFGWMKSAFPRWSPWERLKAWGVWGGVPRYWELQDEAPDLWTAVRENVCSPLGGLRNEPRFLLLDDVEDSAQASTVLSFIGGGAHRASEIAARMIRPMSDLSRPLQRLTELGLVARDHPFGASENGPNWTPRRKTSPSPTGTSELPRGSLWRTTRLSAPSPLTGARGRLGRRCYASFHHALKSWWEARSAGGGSVMKSP